MLGRGQLLFYSEYPVTVTEQIYWMAVLPVVWVEELLKKVRGSAGDMSACPLIHKYPVFYTKPVYSYWTLMVCASLGQLAAEYGDPDDIFMS